MTAEFCCPDKLVELHLDEQYDCEQAYWLSAEGVARQLAEFRAEFGPHGMACECPRCDGGDDA